MPTDTHNGTLYDYNLEQQFSIDDIIGKVPGRFLYSGISMITLVTGCILIMAYFFRYPDKLISTGVLTSQSPPVEILSQTNGYIDTILVQNKSTVEKGDEILRIQNTTDVKQLSQLQNWITTFKKIKDPRKHLKLSFPANLQLGVLQGDYAQLQLKFNELQKTLMDGVVFEQMRNIGREIEKIKSLNDSQIREKEIFSSELSLSRKDDHRQESLFEDGIISELDYEKVKTTTLQKERQYESMEKSVIQNNIRIEQLSLEKLKLKEQRASTIKNYQFLLEELIARISSGIEQWGNTYTIKATINGTVYIKSNTQQNSNVQVGEPLLYILPEASDSLFVMAMFPAANSGKIERGQKGIIKLDAFPHKEYGIIQTKVTDFALLPEADQEGNRFYEVKFSLPSKIKTDYGKAIDYKPNLTCSSEIITEDKSVLERIFNQFISLVNQSV